MGPNKQEAYEAMSEMLDDLMMIPVYKILLSTLVARAGGEVTITREEYIIIHEKTPWLGVMASKDGETVTAKLDSNGA